MGLLDAVFNFDTQREPAECIIKVDGEEITQFYSYVKELTVSMSRKAPTTCSITFDTMRDEFGNWLIQDSGVFRPWMEIEIIAAFGSSHEEQVMHGYIKEVRAEVPQEMSAASVVVTAQDDSLLLNRTQVQGAASSEDTPASDGEMVRQLAGSLMSVDAEEGMTAVSLNQRRSPVEMIRARADANGFEFYLREGTLYFKEPELDGEAQPPLMIYAGRSTNCLSFSVRYDGHLPDQVRITRIADRGSNEEEKSFPPDLPLLGSTAANSESMGLEPFVWDMQQPNGSSWEEMQVQAQAKANENAWKIIAEGELDGSLYGHVLLTHQTVTVDGAGPTDDGIYYVDEVTHRFSMDGYRQKFKLVRNATGETTSVAASIGF